MDFRVRPMTAAEFDAYRSRIGMAWLAVESPDKAGAWIYDIEIVREQRGEGYGRSLLRAVEQLAAERGVTTIGLNVFGRNAVARALYESCGFEVSSLQMRKALRTTS
jgi:ribosomal protein S18 acetylase RimI-like enzyme